MRENMTLGASVLAAITASLCCIGPLAATLLGIGSFGAATLFEAWRPYLLGITFTLLAAAFYFTYHKREVQCADGSVCATRPAVGRWNKILLWLATGLVVAFAAFPYYSGAVGAILLPQREAQPSAGSVATDDSRAKEFVVANQGAEKSSLHENHQTGVAAPAPNSKLSKDGSGRVPPVSAAPTASLTRAAIEIRGMTCAGCAINVEQALKRLPGVQSVHASFEKGEALVEYDPAKVSPEQLKAAIDKIGYKAGAVHTHSSEQGTAPSAASQKVTLQVSGMACPMCAAGLQAKLAGHEGVRSAKVDLHRQEAVIEYDPAKVTPEQLIDAINQTSFKAKL